MNVNKNVNKKKFNIEHWKIISLLLLFYDVVTIALAYFLALYLRFDARWYSIPNTYFEVYRKFILIYILISIIIYYILRLYRMIWRFVSVNEMGRIASASLISGIIHIFATLAFYRRMSISYYAIGISLQFIFAFGLRFSYRFLLFFRNKISSPSKDKIKNIMVVGGGEAGQQLVKDIQNNKNKNSNIVKCIIDDNDNMWNRYILGVPIVGGRESILDNVEKYEIDKIYVALPSISNKERAEILNICKESRCELKSLPGIYQLANDDITVSNMKDVAVEELLERDQITVEEKDIFNFVENKVVLVTGGGGSIGSELCRQLASHNVKQLIIFDIYENTTYEVQQELTRNYPNLNLVVLIGSVRDSKKVDELFNTYKPEIVFHAAAHKHVPLMEDSPCEAIKNNVFGTYKTAYAALAHNCERFVLISTDKAVNPTNIMGASKRMCEMIIQTFDWAVRNKKESILPRFSGHEELIGQIKDGDGITEYVAVRFGNVLGSHGSVIPLFKKQIEDGGPVTVTHPEITRYFMTIPEAVSLVLQAGAYAKGGEIFVLDMGDPVKIDDLAKNLIRLSGLTPNEDIEIVYTGLRPGEKLYEEKLMGKEGLEKTPNKLIHIGHPLLFNHEDFISNIEKLMIVSNNNEEKDVKTMIKNIVTTYKPNNN